MSRNIRVIGGLSDKREEGEGKVKKVFHTFIEKVSVVVEEENLAALMRRNDYLCGMPSIRLEVTNEKVTPGLYFSKFSAK